MSARIRPMPASTPPSPALGPMLSAPLAGSKTLPSALQAAKTVNAMPNGARSRPATLGACGSPWATTMSAAPMMPASTTPISTGALPQAFGMA